MATPTIEKPETSLHGPNLILDVENFGPIAEAKNIEFKPMTVFVGPSNTGKTYLAMLIHSVLQAAGEIGDTAVDPDRTYFEIKDDERLPTLFDDLAGQVANVVNAPNLRNGSIPLRIPTTELSSDASDFLNTIAYHRLREFALDSSDVVSQYFDVANLADLRNRSNDPGHGPCILIRDQVLGNEIQISPSVELVIHPSNHFDFAVDADEFVNLSRIDADEYVYSHDAEIEDAIENFALTCFQDWPSSFSFRAGRSGLIEAHRELVANLIAYATSRSRFLGRRRPLAVALSTGQFLRALASLRPSTGYRASYEAMNRVAKSIEDDVLFGKIEVNEIAGINAFEFHKDGHRVPLEQASSMVTELAPIILFIRQFVDIGDLLIIDEPEAHLHPEAQQQMAAALAFMVRSGLRVLITTHSHYMVEQLSAFVNASKLDEPTRRLALSLGGALGEQDIYLNEEETAVYGFDQSNSEGGTVVYEIPLGEHREYAPRDHSKAVNRQYNRLQRILEARERLGV